MKENNERMSRGRAATNFFQNKIDKVGISKTLIETKKAFEKNSTYIIKDSYNNFRKDARCYPFSCKLSEASKGVLKTFNENRNNLPIFEIEDDDVEYRINFPVIPYRKFFVSSNSFEIIDEEIYSFTGFFVLEYRDFLLVIYSWGRIIKDGWGFSSFALKKDSLYKKDINPNFEEVIDSELLTENSEKRQTVAMKKFFNLMKKLIYKINKNDYSSYKMYSHGVYTEKEISRDVRGHKRHFWEDSGRFILPTLPKEELLKRGYHIAELAIRNGELRRNVPFRLISQFKIGESKNHKNNKIYDLIEKRVWRCEEKIYGILKELFPTNIIRRHDRKTLKGLELDFNLPEFRLGIEYDGEQHFDRDICERVFKSDFDAQVRRDRQKDKLCKKKNIKLLRIKYDELLTKTNIKKKLKYIGVNYV